MTKKRLCSIGCLNHFEIAHHWVISSIPLHRWRSIDHMIVSSLTMGNNENAVLSLMFLRAFWQFVDATQKQITLSCAVFESNFFHDISLKFKCVLLGGTCRHLTHMSMRLQKEPCLHNL